MATNHSRLDLAKHTLDLDLAFHKAHTPGELVERVDGDVDALSRFFSQFVLQVIGNGLLEHRYSTLPGALALPGHLMLAALPLNLGGGASGVGSNAEH